MADVKARLVKEVEECLERITSLSWDVHAKAIRRRDPSPAGDTFGFKADGVMFDVGDSAEWLDKPEGDILLKAFVTAFANPDDEDGISEERSAILKGPEPGTKSLSPKSQPIMQRLARVTPKSSAAGNTPPPRSTRFIFR